MIVRLWLTISVTLLSVQAPAQPDPATVYAWYRADDGLELHADNFSICRWVNHGSQVVPGITQAARDLSRVTGAPQKTWLITPERVQVGAVLFGGNDGLWSARQDFGSISTERTILICARLHDNINQGFLFDATSFIPGLTRAQVRAAFWHVDTAGATNAAYADAFGKPTTAAVTNVWQVHAFIVVTNSTGSRFRHFINGNLAADVQITTNGSLGGLMIGANVAQKLGIAALVSEVLVFNQALPSTERNAIESYLANRWFGVTPDPDAPPVPEVDRVTVFEGGRDGYACYRIPAMVTTLKGTIIAVADGRISGCGDIPNPLDLVAKRSYDNGGTWTPLQVIANYGSHPSDTDIYPAYGLNDPIPRVSSGDAALLLDRTNGRVWVLYDNGGNSNGRKIKLEMRFSDDDGANWSPRIDIEALNPNLRPPGSGEFLTGPGNGIQLSEGGFSGRLVFPVYKYGTPSSSMIIFSDDHGHTWQLGGVAGSGGGEIQVAETAGGALLASMRDNNFPTTGQRTFSRSTDGGISWTAPYTFTPDQPPLPDPACQASILRLTTTNDSNAGRLIFANAADGSSRVKMTLRISYDEGHTWPVSNLVYSGSSAYSSLTPLASGEIGLLFEINAYSKINFVRRSVSEITDGADSLPLYIVWAARRFSPAQMMDATVSGPGADPDHDGFDNEAELTAGTAPLDPASRLELRVICPTAWGLHPLLQFNAVSNRSYAIERAAPFSPSIWERYTNIPTVLSNTFIQVSLSPEYTGFFRLRTPCSPKE
jgi:sialidase-1